MNTNESIIELLGISFPSDPFFVKFSSNKIGNPYMSKKLTRFKLL